MATSTSHVQRRTGVAVLAMSVLAAVVLVTGGLGGTRPAAVEAADRAVTDSGPAHPDGAAPQPVEPGARDDVTVPGWCPTSEAVPDPRRPVVRLRFDVSPDRRTVTGTEWVRFNPDLPVRELVFRLWPNAPLSSAAGASLVVGSVSVDGSSRPASVDPADPTVLGVPLRREIPAGTAVTARLAFVLTLPPVGQDRYGSGRDVAWWGSGHPLLAWVRGEGWQRDPAPAFRGEGAVSEAADTEVTVVAPATDTVLTIGPAEETATPPGAGAGTRAWRAVSSVARDVSVSVGLMQVLDIRAEAVPTAPGVTGAQDPSGIPIRVGVAASAFPGGSPSDVAGAAQSVADVSLASERRMAAHFGSFPYASLSVAVLPGLGSSGIEYPGSVLLGTGAWRQVVPHEVAHQWFYGMVGDNQSRDPWLDEAFATYVESLFNRNGTYAFWVDWIKAPVGGSVDDYGSEVTYAAAVYGRGGGALLSARASSGSDVFDAALTCYVRQRAWSVATPADVAAAFSHLPATIDVLRRTGALT